MFFYSAAEEENCYNTQKAAGLQHGVEQPVWGVYMRLDGAPLVCCSKWEIR